MTLPACVHFRRDDEGCGMCQVGRSWPNGCHWTPFGSAGCAQYQDSPMDSASDEHAQAWAAEWARFMGHD